MSFTISWSLLKLIFISRDAIQPSHPLLSPSPLPSVSPSSRAFSNELALHTSWAKYWNVSCSIIPSVMGSILIETAHPGQAP